MTNKLQLTTAVIKYINNGLEKIDYNNHAYLCFIVLKSAFDRISNFSIKPLGKYKIHDNITELLKDKVTYVRE